VTAYYIFSPPGSRTEQENPAVVLSALGGLSLATLALKSLDFEPCGTARTFLPGKISIRVTSNLPF
jgi:hypothetical protein